MSRSTTLAAALAATLLAACTMPNTQASTMSKDNDAPVAGFATDVAAFDGYIATRPTPAGFRKHYPDVTLVLPGDIATKEFRMNRSRYFAELDGEGRISGGKFQ